MSVGVLALQGSFHEHVAILRRLGVEAIEVRKPEQLEFLSALIIPGGESTTMAKLAAQYNLIPALRDFQASGKPLWGTCAGLIFLANNAVGQKKGGQELLGGLDCTVHRNFFGSQINSFEAELSSPALAAVEGGPHSFRAVFIRAPAILEVGPSVEVLAEYTVPSIEESEKRAIKPTVSTLSVYHVVLLSKFVRRKNAPSDFLQRANQATQTVAVAVKQGNLLGTAFHPELTSDTRWHRFFLKMLKGDKHFDSSISQLCSDSRTTRQYSQPKDLPIFQSSEWLGFEL